MFPTVSVFVCLFQRPECPLQSLSVCFRDPSVPCSLCLCLSVCFRDSSVPYSLWRWLAVQSLSVCFRDPSVPCSLCLCLSVSESRVFPTVSGVGWLFSLCLCLSQRPECSLQFLSVCLFQRPECPLQSLALAGCNMDAQGLKLLTEGLAGNSSLQALNLNNNEVRA